MVNETAFYSSFPNPHPFGGDFAESTTSLTKALDVFPGEVIVEVNTSVAVPERP